MKLSQYVPYAVIAILAFLLFRSCGTAPSGTTRSDTVVTYVTVTKQVQSKPKLVHTYRTDTLTQYDTAYIVQDYTTSKVYTDTIQNDTLQLSITDTISRNAIQGRSVAYTLRLPITTITNTITTVKRPSGLYLGLYGGARFGVPSSIGASATFVTPRYMGSVGYGTAGVQVGVGVRVGR